jgi:hypothetical protein
MVVDAKDLRKVAASNILHFTYKLQLSLRIPLGTHLQLDAGKLSQDPATQFALLTMKTRCGLH